MAGPNYRILVIASQRNQFEIYKQRQGKNKHTYIYIDNSRKLRGYDASDKKNRFVLLGPWLDNTKRGLQRQRAIQNALLSIGVVPEYEQT